MMIALIDADTIVYKFAFGDRMAIDWGDLFTSKEVDLPGAIRRMDTSLDKLQERLFADELILALSCPNDNWRKALYSPYKGNRKAEKPELWAPLRDHLEGNYRTYIRPSLEGDDILGILATHPYLVTGAKVVVSIDKDMRTIPGVHFNPDRDHHFEVTLEQADYEHLFQTLTGDRVDGYPGCPGIGPARAKKLLAVTAGEQWEAIVEAYESKGLTEQDALTQARVARILRSCDYDFKRKEIKLWTPT